ncbi:hypothetical protein RchiOBHm_Chr1g0348551 [Rosa chinensis]|uniref:Uncharacterized protein n=1 Tax=Rosa chinensis TaxID=74649 RepID=A0A2P6SFL1_ROSCH|nr:hypothetical protein RchiOBHm_Chr1g0348551 [Rosa chinensis]
MTLLRQTCPSAQDKLPAAICESIFSLLSLKEAAPASIICRR